MSKYNIEVFNQNALDLPPRCESWPIYSRSVNDDVHVYEEGQHKIQVKMILTLFDSQFPLSSKHNYS